MAVSKALTTEAQKHGENKTGNPEPVFLRAAGFPVWEEFSLGHPPPSPRYIRINDLAENREIIY